MLSFHDSFLFWYFQLQESPAKCEKKTHPKQIFRCIQLSGVIVDVTSAVCVLTLSRPMFEEDVPSVLELEMEELDEWMKKDSK